MSSWDQLVVEPIKEMLTTMAGFIPTLVGALVILILGWVVAKVLQKVTKRFLDIVHFDALTDKAGLKEILSKGGIELTATELFSRLIYWLVMVVVLVMTVNAIGLTVASQLLERLTTYIPKVISALFALIIGMFLANFIAGIVVTAARNAKIPNPELLSSISRWAILIFAGIIALEELGIATLLVSTTFNIFFGAVCLALALAFGLGGKDVAKKILEDFMRKYTNA